MIYSIYLHAILRHDPHLWNHCYELLSNKKKKIFNGNNGANATRSILSNVF
jgi:hypothetical protein